MWGTRGGLAPSGTMPANRHYLDEAAPVVWKPKQESGTFIPLKEWAYGLGSGCPLPLVPQSGAHGSQRSPPSGDLGGFPAVGY